MIWIIASFVAGFFLASILFFFWYRSIRKQVLEVLDEITLKKGHVSMWTIEALSRKVGL